jgi:hypothetical protein
MWIVVTCCVAATAVEYECENRPIASQSSRSVTSQDCRPLVDSSCKTSSLFTSFLDSFSSRGDSWESMLWDNLSTIVLASYY